MTPLDRAGALARLRQMLLIRRFEEKAAELYTIGTIHGFLHLYIGEEAVAVGAMRALTPDDNVVATYREHGQALVRGVPAGAVMAEMYGKANGCSRGRGGSMHLFDVSRRFYGGHAIVGGGLPVAVGLALADRMQARAAVTACFFGDGAVAEGAFSESLNLAALWKLPVIFICENNRYAMGTAIHRALAQTEIWRFAETYGIPGEPVDGMDVLAVREVVGRMVERARRDKTPALVEARTYRFRGHSLRDPAGAVYRTKEEVEREKLRDPIALFTDRCLKDGVLTEVDVKTIEQAVNDVADEAVAFADASPEPPPEELFTDVYKD